MTTKNTTTETANVVKEITTKAKKETVKRTGASLLINGKFHSTLSSKEITALHLASYAKNELEGEKFSIQIGDSIIGVREFGNRFKKLAGTVANVAIPNDIQTVENEHGEIIFVDANENIRKKFVTALLSQYKFRVSEFGTIALQTRTTFEKSLLKQETMGSVFNAFKPFINDHGKKLITNAK